MPTIDRLGRIYNQAKENNLLQDGYTEERFREEMKTEEGRKGFYDFMSNIGALDEDYTTFSALVSSPEMAREEVFAKMKEFNETEPYSILGNTPEQEPIEIDWTQGLNTDGESTLRKAPNEFLNIKVDELRAKGEDIRKQRIEEYEEAFANRGAMSQMNYGRDIQELKNADPFSFLDENDTKHLNRIYDEVGRRRYENNYDGLKEDIQSRLDDLQEMRSATEDPTLESNTAAYLYKKAIDIMNIPSKFGNTSGLENFNSTFWNNLFDRQFFGVTDLNQNKAVENIVTKLNNNEELMPKEIALIDAFMSVQEAMEAREKDMPLGAKIGEGAAKSAPFMVDMILTEGLTGVGKRMFIRSLANSAKAANIAGDAAKAERLLAKAETWGRRLGGSEGITIRSAEDASRTFGALKQGEKVGAKGVGQYVAREAIETPLQTAMMPSSWNIVEQDKINKEMKGEDFTMADFARSFGNAYVETLTERAGGKFIDWGLGKIGAALGATRATFAKQTPWVQMFTHKAGSGVTGNSIIQSPIGETGEEYLGALINYTRANVADRFGWYSAEENEQMRKEALYMFTKEGFLQTFGTVLPMSLGGGALNIAHVAYAGHNYNGARQRVSELLIQAGATKEQAEDVMHTMDVCQSEEEFADKCITLRENLNALLKNDPRVADAVSTYKAATFNYKLTVNDFYEDYLALTPEQRAQADKDFKDMKKTMTKNTIIGAVGKEMEGRVNEDDKMVYEVTDANGRHGFVKKGHVDVFEDNDGVSRISPERSEQLTIQWDGASDLEQVGAGSVTLVSSPVDMETYADNIATARANQASSEDMFEVGDAVYAVVNGEVVPDVQPSQVVSVDENGVTITTAEGVAQTLSHEQAQEGLLSGRELESRRQQKEMQDQLEKMKNGADPFVGVYLDKNDIEHTITKDEEGKYILDGANAIGDDKHMNDMRSGLTSLGFYLKESAKPFQESAAPTQKTTPAQDYVAQHGEKAAEQVATDITAIESQLAAAEEELAAAQEAMVGAPSDALLAEDEDLANEWAGKKDALAAARIKVEKKKLSLDKYKGIQAAIADGAVEVSNEQQTAAQIAQENVGKPQKTVREMQQEITLRTTLDKLQQLIGVEVVQVESLADVKNEDALREIHRDHEVKGWYDDAEKKAYLYMPNVRSVQDAVETIFHESVAHKGIREVLGETFKDYCHDVFDGMMPHLQKYFAEYAYNTMSVEKQKAIAGDTAKASFRDLNAEQRKAVLASDYIKEVAADEYMANVAEECARKFLENPDVAVRESETSMLLERFVNRVRGWLGIDYTPNVTKRDIIRMITASRLGDKREYFVQKQAEQLASKEPQVVTNEVGEVVATTDGKGESRMSIKTWNEGGRDALIKYLDGEVKKNNITAEDRYNMIREMDDICDAATRLAKSGESPMFSQWSVEEVRTIDGTSIPVMHALKDNAEYALNIDFSTVCKKRMEIDKIMNKLIADGTLTDEKLSPQDIARINQIIQKHGLEIACQICFVDSRRYNAFVFAEGFLNKYNPLVASLAGIKDLNEAVDKVAGFNYSGNTTFTNEGKIDLTNTDEVFDITKAVLASSRKTAIAGYQYDWGGVYDCIEPLIAKAKAIMENKGFAKKFEEYAKKNNIEDTNYNRAAYAFSLVPANSRNAQQKMALSIIANPSMRLLAKMEDFVASEGWVNVMESNPELEKLWNIQKGAAGAKANEGNVQYQNDVIKKIARGDIYDIAGYRMQSFSDFIGRMWFDYMQAFAELAAKQLPGHAYTKEPNFVKLFGLMGMKINMSLVFQVDPKADAAHAGLTQNEKGEWVYNFHETIYNKDRTEVLVQGQTFDPMEAFALQAEPGYTRNCGTIAVGLSDEHIRMMLADPNIRMVIPYHKSGLLHGVELIYNMEKINDYTNVQNTMSKLLLAAGEGFDGEENETASGNKKKKSAYTSEQKKAMKADMNKRVDRFNFFLHQLSIAEDKTAAYNALRHMFVLGDAAKVEDIHKEFTRVYNAIVNGEITDNIERDELSERHDDNTFIPKMAAKIYLDACKEWNYQPKFPQFADHSDYYKVLIDFAVYDRDGNYTPQEAIKFNTPDNLPQLIKAAVAEDEKFNKKGNEVRDVVCGMIKAYLADKKLREEQDRIAAKKGELTKQERLTMAGPSVYKVGDKRNIPTNAEFTILGIADKNTQPKPNETASQHAKRVANGETTFRIATNDVFKTAASESFFKARYNEISVDELLDEVEDINNKTINNDGVADAVERIRYAWGEQDMDLHDYAEDFINELEMGVFGALDGETRMRVTIFDADNAKIVDHTRFRVDPQSIVEEASEEQKERWTKSTDKWWKENGEQWVSQELSEDELRSNLAELDNWKSTALRSATIHYNRVLKGEDIRYNFSKAYFNARNYLYYDEIKDLIKKELERRGLNGYEAHPNFIAELGLSSKNSYSVRDVRSWFDKYNTNKESSALFDLIMPVLLEIEKNGFSAKLKNPSRKGWSGLWSITSRELCLRPSYFAGEGTADDFTTTILHECIHACTSYALWVNNLQESYRYKSYINDNISIAQGKMPKELRDAAKELVNLFDTIRYNNEIRDMYGATNAHEMVAELANPKFREALKKQNLLQKIIDGIYRFINKVSAYFNGEEYVEVNAYDVAYRCLVKMIENYDENTNTRQNHINELNFGGAFDKIDYVDSGSTRFRVATMGSYFSGGGLVECGVRGLVDSQFGVEFDNDIVGVYRDNHGDHVINADVRDPNVLSEIIKRTNGSLDYFHASPVCHNYSNAKNKADRVETELDIETAKATAKLIREVKPRIVTVENAPAYKDNNAVQQIISALNESGYTFDYGVYNSKDFGGVMNRDRFILRAVLGGSLPAIERVDGKRCWMDAVEDILPTLKKGELAEWQKERLKKMGVDYENVKEPLLVYGGSNNANYIPMAYASELAPSINTKEGGSRIIMPNGDVLMCTPRFFARLMGLPDSYELPSSVTLGYKVIGNGVPVNLTEGIIRPLLEENGYDTNEDADELGVAEEPTRFRVITDPNKIAELESEDKIYVYRAMQKQVIDGKVCYLPPMAGKVGGKWVNPTPIGEWIQSDENLDGLVFKDGVWKFKLDKGNNKSLYAAYNPYFHTSFTPLNDQFSEAQSRDELVMVRCEVPISELSSGYKADKAKDAVGEMSWHSGPVSSIIAREGNPRRVVLTRYCKVVKEVPMSEVADDAARLLGDGYFSQHPLPSNAFMPELRKELEKRGYDFVETDNRGKLEEGSTWAKEYGVDSKEYKKWEKSHKVSTRFRVTPAEDAAYLDAVERGDMETAKKMVMEAAKKAGYNSPKLYHGTDMFGFTQIRTDGVEKGYEWSPFFASNNESTSASYTLNGNVRRISDDAEISREDAIEQHKENIKDLAREFRRAIDRYFSEWYFGQTDNSYIEKKIEEANPNPGEVDGVYDTLVDILYNAFYKYRDNDEKLSSYEGAYNWMEESEDGKKTMEIVLAIEGEKSAIYNIENGDEIGGIYEMYANLDNLYVIDAKGSSWSNLRSAELPKISRWGVDDVPYKTRDVAIWAKDNGYNGVIFKNVVDNGGYGKVGESDVYCFFSPASQIKSADPVTYDDNGNVIPLSERFNENNADIRFRVAPTLDENEELYNYEERMREFRAKYGEEMADKFEEVADIDTKHLTGKQLADLIMLMGKMHSDSMDSIRDAQQKVSKRISAVNERIFLQGMVDRGAVEELVQLAKMFIKSGWADEAGKRDIAYIVSSIQKASRRASSAELEDAVNTLVDAMVHANAKKMASIMHDMMSLNSRKNSAGVPIAGQLGLRQRKFIESFNKYIGIDSNQFPNRMTELNDELAQHSERIARFEELDGKETLTKEEEDDKKRLDKTIENDYIQYNRINDEIISIELADAYKTGVVTNEEEVKKISNNLAVYRKALEYLPRINEADAIKTELLAEQERLEHIIADETIEGREKTSAKARLRGVENRLKGLDKLNEIYAAKDDNARATERTLYSLIKTEKAAYRSVAMNLIDGYVGVSSKLSGIRKEGKESYADWLQQERDRKERIRHYWRSDRKGQPYLTEELRPLRGFAKDADKLLQFMESPVKSFLYMLKDFSVNAPEGKGYLYNHFCYGLMEAEDRYWTRKVAAMDMLDKKATELFGKKRKVVDSVRKRTFIEVMNNESQTNIKFTIKEGENDKQVNYTAGQLMYLYQVNKMADGREKLEAMGWTEENVDAATKALKKANENFIALADYIQQEFLPTLRKEYEKTFERMFGTAMPYIENYVPLQISDVAIDEVVDLNDKNGGALPSTVTKNLISRVRNTKPIALESVDMLELILSHVNTMEHWNAFAEVTRDLNTLLSDRAFKNSINAGLGNTRHNYEDFKNVCKLAVGCYEPSKEDGLSAVIKKVGGAKVAFRWFTALKQLLSFPAFMDNIFEGGFILYSVKNLVGSVKWGKENLPSLNKRWESRFAGDENLDLAAGQKNEFVKGVFKPWVWLQNHIMRHAMIANSGIDLITCAWGARSVYDAKRAKYIHRGYSVEEAERRAKLDAEIAFNETQQSSEGMFLSAMQKDRDFINRSISLFNNSSFAYGRKFFEGIRESWRSTVHTKERYEFRKKQLMRDGLTEEKAEKFAKIDEAQAIAKGVLDTAIFGWVIQTCWNIGGGAYALLFSIISGDDEKKKRIIDEAAIDALIQPVRGLPLGASAESIFKSYISTQLDKADLRKLAKEKHWSKKKLEKMEKQIYSTVPSDRNAFLKYIGQNVHPAADELAKLAEIILDDDENADALKAADTSIRFFSQFFMGVDAGTLYNVYYGFADMVARYDDITWVDVYQDLGYILNAPPSQVKYVGFYPRPGESAIDYRNRYVRMKILQKYGTMTPWVGEDVEKEMNKKYKKKAREERNKNKR